MDYPPEIERLLQERNQARKDNNYALSDSLREQIIALGYTIQDTSEGTTVKKISENPPVFLTVFGSGETSSIGRKAHEYVFSQMQKKEINIGIVTTPAGFQPNVKIVHEEIKEFFEEHLANFHPQVTIIYANTREDANNPEIASQVDSCDYIFLGPGSPTYTVNHLKDTLILEKIIATIKKGTSLCLSSAAALAFSEHCLPVYEIYKVGSKLHWVEGLNIYSTLINQNLTVIPHFNNTEGGSKTDTSRCFMGESRFKTLLSLLPNNDPIIGIDEQTSKIWNLSDNTQTTEGKGKVTDIRL